MREVERMADTPRVTVRVAPDQLDAARAAVGRPGLDVAVLVRAGLAILADPNLSPREALAKAQARPGPKPKAHAEPARETCST
jgi:flagellar biosynthesis/type III secretory pathway protein FliH